MIKLKNILLGLILSLVYALPVWSQNVSAEYIYNAAKDKNVSYLRRIGNYIDYENKDGDTALCIALSRNDKSSYELLKSYGAKTTVACVKKTDKKEFLKMGTTGWTIAGVAVVAGGAIAAVAGGGGGGGGSSSTSSSDSTKKLDCKHGMREGNICQCNSGWAGASCNEADDNHIIGDDGNLYEKLNCNHGHQVKNTCACDAGYTGASCNEADDNHIIGDDGNLYEKLNCNHGHQVKNTCACDAGYTGASCNEADDNHIIGDDGNLYEKLNCNHGHQVKNTCACDAGYTGASCNEADDNHIIGDDGNLYEKLNCNHGHQVKNTCACDAGYTGASCNEADDNHIIGDDGNLYEKLDCNHGHQTKNICTCDAGYTGASCNEADDNHIIGDDGNLYEKLNCNHGHQVKNTCACDAGYTGASCNEADDNHIIGDDGNLYEKLNCNHGHQVKNTCACDAGYTGASCNEADDNHIIGDDGNLYEKLNCNHGHQVKNTCACDAGYTGASCNEADDNHIIGDDGNLYEKLNCNHGHQTKNICTCDAGYTGASCNEADDNHIIGDDGNLYEKLNCQNGSLQVNNMCNCTLGYIGVLCENILSCPTGETTISCSAGYVPENTENYSGSVQCHKCVPVDHTGYDLTQPKNGEGWNCEAKNSAGTMYYKCTKKPCVEGSVDNTCPSNYHLEPTNYYAGDEQCYKCVENSLDCGEHGSQIDGFCSCATGYTGTLCDQVDDNYIIGDDGNPYQKLNCQNGGVQKNDKCQCTAEYTGALCDQVDDDYFKDDEDGQIYDKLNCNHGHQSKNTCVCDTGYDGLLCDQADNNHIIGDDGNLYDKLACEHGVQNKNICTCEENYDGELCDTPKLCPEGEQTAPCAEGYTAENTTNYSGDELCHKCLPSDHTGYDLTQPKIGDGWNCEAKKSGDMTYYRCELKPGYIIGQDGSAYLQLDCQHNGVQLNASCICISGWTGETCSDVADGYFIDDENGNLYKELSCVHGNQEKDKCICESGYSGILCDRADKDHIIGTDGNLYNKLDCEHGKQVNGTCVCSANWTGTLCNVENACPENTYKQCPTDYIQSDATNLDSGDICYRCIPVCDHGAADENDKCVCDTGYTGNLCDKLKLGYEVEPDGSVHCAEGFEIGIAGDCVSKSQISGKDASSGDHYQYFVNNDKIHLVAEGVIDVYAMKDTSHGSSSKIIANAFNGSGIEYDYNNAQTEENNAEIKIRKTGSGNAYGLYSSFIAEGQSDSVIGNITNASGWYERQIGEEYIHFNMTGLIDIENNGSGDVFGIFSNNVYNYNDSSFGYPYDTLFSDNIYGLFPESDHKIANAQNEGNGIINIKNSGNGMIYGICSSVGRDCEMFTTEEYYNNADNNVYNVISLTNADKYNTVGIINIENDGNGDVFGLYASGFKIRGINLGTEEQNIWRNYYNSISLVQNAYAGNGITRINNSGTGNIYGIYGDLVSNASDDFSQLYDEYNDYYIPARGKISLINQNSGTAVGMLGHLSVINAKQIKENPAEPSIEIINTADGIAVGMYGLNANGAKIIHQDITSYPSQEYTYEYAPVKNDDTIGIHNLGDGIAVGMFALANKNDKPYNNTSYPGESEPSYVIDIVNGVNDAGTYNTGKIIINRDDYTDIKPEKLSDEMASTYSADDIIGGMAVGIYDLGKYDLWNSVSQNTGDIMINRAKFAIGYYKNSDRYNNDYNNSVRFVSSNIDISQSQQAIGVLAKAVYYNSGSYNQYHRPSIYHAADSVISISDIHNLQDEDYDMWPDYVDNYGVGIGIYTEGSVDNYGSIYLNNVSNAVGIYSKIDNEYNDTDYYHQTVYNRGNIIIDGAENAIGIYGKYVSNADATTSYIDEYGEERFSDDIGETETVHNRGNIVIRNATNAIGIYATDGATNAGDITIEGAYNAIGMMGQNLTNTETGVITINLPYSFDVETYSDQYSYSSFRYVKWPDNYQNQYAFIGMMGGNIVNNGTIVINGYETQSTTEENEAVYQNDIFDTPQEGTEKLENAVARVQAIVLNGGVFTQAGTLKAKLLNLNHMDGDVIASTMSVFSVEGPMSGNLIMSTDIVTSGFEDTYTVENMIQAGDTSELNLVSQSALFDATLQNGTDAVMTMKAFSDVVENSSVADFLQANYAEGNNEKLFSTLKSSVSIAQLNSNIDDLFGKDMLSRMAFEDLSMLREVSLDMNNHLFKQKGAFAFGGNVSPSSYDNNIGSIGRYSLNGFNNGKMSFGVGVSITDVRTDDGHSDNRRFDRNFMMSAPIGYKTHGFELIIAPKMGYADGTYNRDGFNNMTYEGKVQKRMFALMNEARYPVKFGGLKLMPTAEFNMIGYNIKGHEDEKEYSLRIKSQNHYSVEAGLGLMAEKEFKPHKNHKFNVSGGVAVYHEFADPYELDVAMNGMSGTYRLHDEKRSDNRAAIRFGFGYELKDYIDVTANFLTNIDREYRTDASIDMKYHF